MSVDPAVRSIRIATTLSERFAVLLRSNPIGPSGNLSALELRIGEAQQIYPEIWSHLDEARATLAGRGANVSGYDAIRAMEPRGSLGVTRVDVDTYATSFTSELLGARDEMSKIAHFNREGHQRAIAAGKALMGAMSDVDWVAVARQENAELAAVGSLGAASPMAILRWLAISAGAIAVTYAFWYFVVRTPKVDHRAAYEAQQADRAAERKARSEQLLRELAAVPCDRAKWKYGKSDIVGDVRAIERDLEATCKSVITGIKARLAQDPCDAADLAELEARDLWFGSSVAKADHDYYESACDLTTVSKGKR